MNIVYASNDSYARHLGVSMCSLFDRNRNCRSLSVYVLSLGLSEDSRKGLEEIAKQYGRELVIVEMGDLKERFHFPVDTGGYDISIMSRIFMGEMLPDSVERVLYLDCDTVVVQPLRRLWDTNLQGKIMGAVMEPTIYQEVKDFIDLGMEQPYFNSGVLLVDLKQWRDGGIQNRLLRFWQDKGGKLFASDQDLLNGALKGEIMPLDPRYNFFTNYRYFSYEDLAKHSPSYRAVTKEAFMEAKRHPAIIHYMGDERPWIRGNLNHYRRAYDQYLAKTPWAGTAKEKGKELYMAAYHGLDYLTAACPRARWFISRKLGMKMVEARAGKQKEKGQEKI